MRHSAKRFFAKAPAAPHTSTPRVSTVDKNAAYPKAFKELKAERIMPDACELRQSKYLNNLVEQDPTRVLSLSMVDNSVFSPKRLTILIDPAYSPFIRKLSMPHISSSEDLYGPSCVLVPVRVLPHTLSGAALASLPAPSSAFPLKSRGYAHHSPASPQATHPT